MYLNDKEISIFDLLLQDITQTEIANIVGVNQVKVSRTLSKIRKKYNELQLSEVA
jgi:DNA-directed RNA polymerase specialized sigma subunit